MSAQPRMIRRSVHLSVAVLALWGMTACGTEESEPDESTGVTEEVTEDATEPAQDQTAGSDGDEEPDEADAEPPEFEDIQEVIWSAAQAQESVRITGQMANPNGDASPEGPVEDSDASASHEEAEADVESDDDTAAEDVEPLSLAVYGDLAGESSAFQLGEVYDYLLFGDDVLQSVDSLVMEYEQLQPEGTEAPDAEEIREAFSAAGSWANLGPTAQGLIETPGLFLRNLEQGFTQAQEQAEDESAADWSVETDVHEGEEVWVYSRGESGDGPSITVLADEEEPLLVHLGYENLGEPATSIDFLDWNETEGPERPDDMDVISPEEVQMILQEVGG